MAQNFLACDREQPFLLPPDVREWLADDHLAWFVIDAVGVMDTPTIIGEEEGAAMARRVVVCRGAPGRVELTAATYGRPSLWAASQVRSPCGLSLVNSVVEM